MKYIYLFVLVYLSNNLLANGMFINGVISDIDNQQPIKEAFVYIKFFDGFEFSTTSDSLGKYVIKTNAVVPDGYYTVEVDAKDYYKLNGFVYVTKNANFNFSLKSKQVKTINIQKDSAEIQLKPPAKLDGFATNNLVFLIDISASMNVPDKMPLLKESMKYLVSELRPTDRVAMLTFSNNTKEILPSTPVSNKELINKTIDDLVFGSTTEGSTAIDYAYKTAANNFIQNGNNRIILASDGMFTSGEKAYKKMKQTIASGIKKNITLSIFCFGKNTDYTNSKLKELSNVGSGNFANILNADEGKQHLLEEAQAVKKVP